MTNPRLRYHEAILSLAGQCLHRSQFRRHRAELEPLDDSRQDAEGRTEWGELLDRTADMLERVAALYPLDVSTLLVGDGILLVFRDRSGPEIFSWKPTILSTTGARLRSPSFLISAPSVLRVMQDL